MNTKQIFLIEDDPDDQEIFLAALTEFGNDLDCATAVNGFEGFQKLTTEQVNPAVIFLDLNMPLMNGYEFLEKIKKHDQLKSIPVIILTTSSNPNTVYEVKQLGAWDMITKPGSYTELVGILQATLTNIL